MIELKKHALQLFAKYGVYIRSRNVDEAREIQDLLFKLGFGWNWGVLQEHRYLNSEAFACLISEDKKILQCSSLEAIDSKEVELTIIDLKALVNVDAIYTYNRRHPSAKMGTNGNMYLLTAESLYWFDQHGGRWDTSMNDIDWFIRSTSIGSTRIQKSYKPLTEFNEVW